MAIREMCGMTCGGIIQDTQIALEESWWANGNLSLVPRADHSEVNSICCTHVRLILFFSKNLWVLRGCLLHAPKSSVLMLLFRTGHRHTSRFRFLVPLSGSNVFLEYEAMANTCSFWSQICLDSAVRVMYLNFPLLYFQVSRW